MRDISRTLKFSKPFLKGEKASDDYVPTTPSAEAQICLNCTEKTCKPSKCKRFAEEKAKLRGKKND